MVIFFMYNIVIFISKSGGRNEWSKYCSKNGRRKMFQVYLALEMMERAIRMDWEAPYDESTKPNWMRKKTYIPCNCNKFFFCKEGMTNGIFSKQRSVPSPTKKRKRIR